MQETSYVLPDRGKFVWYGLARGSALCLDRRKRLDGTIICGPFI